MQRSTDPRAKGASHLRRSRPRTRARAWLARALGCGRPPGDERRGVSRLWMNAPTTGQKRLVLVGATGRQEIAKASCSRTATSGLWSSRGHVVRLLEKHVECE